MSAIKPKTKNWVQRLNDRLRELDEGLIPKCPRCGNYYANRGDKRCRFCLLPGGGIVSDEREWTLQGKLPPSGYVIPVWSAIHGVEDAALTVVPKSHLTAVEAERAEEQRMREAHYMRIQEERTRAEQAEAQLSRLTSDEAVEAAARAMNGLDDWEWSQETEERRLNLKGEILPALEAALADSTWGGEMNESGVTRTRVLFFLHHHGPLSFAQLADYLAEQPAVLFGSADELALRTLLYTMWQSGLIAGAKVNEKLKGWELTDRGRLAADSTRED
jgi:hypothetical protein